MHGVYRRTCIIRKKLVLGGPAFVQTIFKRVEWWCGAMTDKGRLFQDRSYYFFVRFIMYSVCEEKMLGKTTFKYLLLTYTCKFMKLATIKMT